MPETSDREQWTDILNPPALETRVRTCPIRQDHGAHEWRPMGLHPLSSSRWCQGRGQDDVCPLGGVHDPRDSDRPCPRCGASPR